jgi:hypothetical protein
MVSLSVQEKFKGNKEAFDKPENKRTRNSYKEPESTSWEGQRANLRRAIAT